MSANDYYNDKPLPNPSTQAYYPPYAAQSSYHQDPTPPYSSQPNLAPDRPAAPGTTPSPFDTPFDDHVYPSNAYHTPASSQHHFGQEEDTSYHGIARVPSDEMAHRHPTDDIPLQDRAHKDLENDDHVYEAPNRRKSRKGPVRFGELGMFGANAKRIPWVTYLFTVIQVAVFIAEIVKNGKHYLFPPFFPLFYFFYPSCCP